MCSVKFNNLNVFREFVIFHALIKYSVHLCISIPFYIQIRQENSFSKFQWRMIIFWFFLLVVKHTHTGQTWSDHLQQMCCVKFNNLNVFREFVIFHALIKYSVYLCISIPFYIQIRQENSFSKFQWRMIIFCFFLLVVKHTHTGQTWSDHLHQMCCVEFNNLNVFREFVIFHALIKYSFYLCISIPFYIQIRQENSFSKFQWRMIIFCCFFACG